MSSIIQVLPDPFKKQKNVLTEKILSSANKYDSVRRPTNGLINKKDTYALLEVKTKRGENLLLIDSGGSEERGDGIGYGARNSNFIIQSISEQRMEKQQMVETFGPLYIFFFGERPVNLNVVGMLLNSNNFNWKNEFIYNYDNYLRGTACVNNKALVHLSYDDVVRTGYILSCSVDQSADNNEMVQFSFQMIVSDTINLSTIGRNKPSLEISEEEPQLNLIENNVAANLQKTTSSLIDSLRKGISFVQKYQNQAKQLFDKATSYLTGHVLTVNATNVAASSLFDIDKTKTYSYNSSKGVVVIPTATVKYNENDEEYIARTTYERSRTIIYTHPESRAILEGKALALEVKARLTMMGVNTGSAEVTNLISKGGFAALNIGVSYIPRG